MRSEYSAEELSIREQLAQSERTLDEFERELETVEAELEALARKSQQYDVLADACRSLEQLDELGAGHLFWEEQGGRDEKTERLRYARRRLEEFSDEVVAVEERRQSIIDKIGDQNEVLDCLHYDLKDAISRDIRRKEEWLVERDADDPPFRSQVMPWTRGLEEDRRFRRFLGMSLAASVAVALLLGMVTLPIKERPQVTELPDRITKLVRQERTPPPPAAVAEPEIPEEEPPEPEPELAKEQPPEQLPAVAEEPVLANVKVKETKERVRSKGILAFRDSFASSADTRPSARLGSQASVRNTGQDAVGRPRRMMVSTSAPGSSGGIDLAEISRDVGGGGQAMEGVQLARVASSIGGGDGPDRPLGAGAPAGRTDEEIQIVFDRYKAALYRLYNRELRRDPTLRGQLVLRLTIEPDGSVSLCQLQASDMDAPALAQQVVDRVLTFDFGAKDGIVAVTIIYPIDFLPAA